MSIYIKGLHLPRPSLDPRLPSPNRFVVVQIYDNGDAIIHGYGTCGGSFEHYTPNPSYSLKKLSAYEIQPHERLIEAGKIGLSDFEIIMCNGDYRNCLQMLIDKIEAAPTIIEAEEE